MPGNGPGAHTRPPTHVSMYSECFALQAATLLRDFELCGETDPEVWDRRLETLEQRFGRDWSVLRCDIAISMAAPKQRDEEELEISLSRFKLAYKQACLQHFLKQKPGPMKSFFRDIFHDKETFIEYVRFSPTVCRFQSRR